MPLSVRALPSIRTKAAAFSNLSITSVWKLNSILQGILFLSKPPQTLQYRGRTLVQTFTPDFICYDKIILEIKAVSALVDEHRAQLLNYLKCYRL